MIELSLILLSPLMLGSKQNSIPPNDSVNEVLLVLLSDIAMIKKLQLIDYIISLPRYIEVKLVHVISELSILDSKSRGYPFWYPSGQVRHCMPDISVFSPTYFALCSGESMTTRE